MRILDFFRSFDEISQYSRGYDLYHHFMDQPATSVPLTFRFGCEAGELAEQLEATSVEGI